MKKIVFSVMAAVLMIMILAFLAPIAIASGSGTGASPPILALACHDQGDYYVAFVKVGEISAIIPLQRKHPTRVVLALGPSYLQMDAVYVRRPVPWRMPGKV